MAKFAHIETGFALDVQENANADDYIQRYRGLDISGWTVVEVPLGTEHGAKVEGGGNYENPAPAPAITPPPISLSKTAFRAHCVANLGGGGTGILRFQEIMNALKAGDDLQQFCYDEYVAADVFDKDKTDTFLTMISGVLQAGEKTAIIDNWPRR